MTTGPRVTRKDLKQDKVYVTMAGAVDFLVRNRLAIALAVLVAIAAVGLGYHMVSRAQRAAGEASWALYQAGFIEDSSEKIAALEKVTDEYGGAPAGVFAEFELANALYSDEKYDEALRAFEKFLKENPGHLLAPSAVEAVGYCEESLGRWDDAIRTYEGLIDGAPSGPAAARANFRLGHCREKLDDKEKAIDAYERVIELAPMTLWADYANQRLESLDPEKYAASETQPSFPPGLSRPFTPPPPPPE